MLLFLLLRGCGCGESCVARGAGKGGSDKGTAGWVGRRLTWLQFIGRVHTVVS